jgi:conjugative relaxase-like TrwC/TraI family protein
MLTLSKPISAGQGQAYHRSEFANAKENYYTEGERVRGEWQGQLAERYGLRGEVNEEQFARLSEGQHPATGEALIRRQQAREYVNPWGETVRTMEHRAGWDATFSAPKSVSVTVLVGGDIRAREAHRESVRVALDEMEKYAQARIGGNAPAQTTGAWAVAKFEHDSSRPVDGYAAPQLHTHAVIFNVTETAEGNTRSLQARELYRTQQFATAVYRSELAARLQSLGYEVERGAHGQPEIKGYTREYMEASSPWTFERHPHLSLSQHRAVEDVLESRDKMMALEGVAGAGKTTSLTAIRDAVEHHGYEVKGLAPTSRAAQKLAETGIATETLQRHLARGQQPGREPDGGRARVYVVDEASMVSTRQMHTFLERLNRHDRVLFVGDVRQHEAVEAGRPYAQMQEAGLRTARLDEILRQKDPVLKETVEQLARGEVKQAVENLNWQGRVHEFKDRGERLGEIAREYARLPEKTLVISPDNASRQEINRHIHRAMREAGHVTGADHRVPVLHARQELTGADRQHAQNYEPGNVVRYSKGSKPLGIEPGEYARVARVDEESNTVTITRKSGEDLSYDPRRLQGVTVYRDGERSFAQGDRVQMTSPYQALHLANRELGTIQKIDGDGNLKVKMDSGREVGFNMREMPHLDYGYAVTSHSSQGQTADRVLVHVDSEQSHGELLNSRMAYVSVSRAQFDVQMYTNDAKTLGQVLSRDVSHPTATQQQMTMHDELAGQKILPQSVDLDISQGHGLGLGH